MEISALKKLFSFGTSERSARMNKNILYSFLIRFLGIAVNLLYVPLTINYINTERYGIWLTVSSMIGWMSLLDIGFGNGLRNKFAEASVKNDIKSQQKLVHTTLFVICLISMLLFIFGIYFSKIISWDQFLGVSPIYRKELQQLFFYIIILFSFQFIFQVVSPINYAIQKSSLVSLTSFIGNVLGLLGIIILKTYFSPSLLWLGIVIMLGNVIALAVTFFHYFFYLRFDLITSFKLPYISEIKTIFSLGVKFFVVNIAYVVQYQTTNFLISKYFSSESVSEFNIAFKLFSIASIIFGIIITPVWSTVTNAYANNDYEWINKLIKKLLLLWCTICGVCVIILIFSNQIYYLWIGNSIKIPILTSIGVAIVICSNCFSSIFIQTLNGLSKVNLQFILSLITIPVFIPIAYYFSVYLDLKVFGICLAIVLTNINGLIVAPIQLRNIIQRMHKSPNNKTI